MRAATVTIETLRSAPSLVITRTDAAAALGVDPRTVTAGIEKARSLRSSSAAAC